jgi:site-specific recombinase XerD
MLHLTIILPDYVHEFMEDLLLSGRSKLTLKQYESDLKKFFSWFQRHKQQIDLETLKSLRKEDIREYFHYLNDINMAQATIRRLASVLSRLMKFHQCIAAHEIHKLSEAPPLRTLTPNDFINGSEYKTLISSMKSRDVENTKKSARNFLITRNLTIISFIRTFGLTPTDIYQLTMKNINLAQKELIIKSKDSLRKFSIDIETIDYLRDYFFSIPELFRPKYHSNDPLFVAFNNISLSFQYDYDSQKPKALTVRSIQEMIKDEVKKAQLRKISAVTLRNTAIHDEVLIGKTDDQLMTSFALTSEGALRRYKQYIENKGIY